jgi:hypothetical protein
LRSRALLWALALGVLADLLVRVDGRPGLNITLWAVAGVTALFVLVRQRGDEAAPETWWLVGGALTLAGALALRDAEALAVFALFGAVVLLILAAGRGSGAWASRAHVSDIVLSVLRVAALCAAGPLGWGRVSSDGPRASGWHRWARTLLRGAAMALPALLLLASLLMTADPVFERIVQDTLSFDIEPVIEHLVFTAVIGWIAAGYLRGFLVRDDTFADRFRVPMPGCLPRRSPSRCGY